MNSAGRYSEINSVFILGLITFGNSTKWSSWLPANGLRVYGW